MFTTHALTPSQATAVKMFEAHLNLEQDQAWVMHSSEIPLRSGHSSFISAPTSVQDIRPTGNWKSPQLLSVVHLTSVDGYLLLSVSEVCHSHALVDYHLKTWLLQASDCLLNANYSFLWCERGTDVMAPRRPLLSSSSWPSLPSQKEGSLFNWEGVPQLDQTSAIVDHSSFSMF